MALKKLQKNMSYEAVRYKHPATPNHAATPTSLEDTDADKTVEPSSSLQDDHREVPVDEPGPVLETPVEPEHPHDPAEPPRPDRKQARGPAASRSEATGKTVRVRGYIHVPAAGEHPAFDELREIYGEKEALALALTRGLALYEAALRGAKPLGRPPRLDRRSGRVEVSRTMADDLYVMAVEHLDPKAMLGRSQIGSRILGAALSYHLEGK